MYCLNYLAEEVVLQSKTRAPDFPPQCSHSLLGIGT